MNTRTAYVRIVAALLFVACLVVACGGAQQAQPGTTKTAPTAAPAVNGGTLLNERCVQCHSLDRVKQATRNLAEWETTVARMRGNGANLTDSEAQTLVQYLAQTYGK